MDDAGSHAPGNDTAESQMLAFLIADIRGYTRFTQERGDEAAGKLAARFAAITREVVTGAGGTLLELRGDEALVVFDSARQALRAAVALQQRLVTETQWDPDLPLPVGVGLDVGEVVRVEGGYRGRALNFAARLCSAAGPGEVIASSLVVHLAGRVDEFRYVDKPALSLKGVDTPVSAVLVMPVGEDPAQQLRALGALPSAGPPPKTSRRRNALIAVGIAAAVAAAAVLVVLTTTGGGGQSYRPGTLLMDLTSGKPLATIPTSQLSSPGFPLYDGKHFWVANAQPESMAEIDPHSGKILTQFASSVASADSQRNTYQPYTVVGDTLWGSDGDDVVKYDTRIGREVDRLHLDGIVGSKGLSEGVTYGDGILWVSRDVGPGQVVGVDPDTGKLLHRFDHVRNHSDIAYSDGTIWAADYNGVDVIDVATGTVTTAPDIDGTNRSVHAGGGFGWTAEAGKGLVYKIDKDGRVAASYHAGLGAAAGSFADGTLWSASYDEGSATGTDAITGAQTTYEFGHPVGVVAAGGGVLLAWLQPGVPLDTRIAGLEGDVLRLFSQQGEFGDGDEAALNWGTAARQIDYATCANLLNYPDKTGAAGAQLQPEVAAAMPALSKDRRTYTFTVRPGYRFSPPSNQPVTAETFRYTIERALSPKLGDNRPGPFFVGDIEGEAAFRAGKASHISGLRAAGDELTITLTHPSADFPARISLPYFCPVPTGTAFVPGAVSGSGGGFLGGAAIPSAGPYYISYYVNENLIILKANPNYRGPRPHPLDAIALREGVDASVAVERVQNGEYDGIVSSGRNGAQAAFDPLLSPDGEVADRYASGGDSALRYVGATVPGAGFLDVNLRRPAFQDPAVRRAASVALDRATIARIWDTVPAADVVPPAYAAGLPGGAAQTDVPPADPGKARRLLHGRRVHVTMASFAGCDPCDSEARAVRAQLGQAGFVVRVKQFDDYESALSPSAHIDLLDSGTGLGYPDAASYLTQVLTQAVPQGWLPVALTDRAAALDGKTGAARQQAAAALARDVARIGPIVTYGTYVQPELFGPTVGCRTFTVQSFGVDLAALCLSR